MKTANEKKRPETLRSDASPILEVFSKNQDPVTFGLTRDHYAKFPELLKKFIISSGAKSICDIGGGATPMIDLGFITEHNLDYVVLDISSEELSKTPQGYKKVCADICVRDKLPKGTFDFVFSHMVAEHVPNAEIFYKNLLYTLKPNGVLVNFFPTLYSPPFLANWVLSTSISTRLKRLVTGGASRTKFPAYYQWCYGPTKKQLSRMDGLQARILGYQGLFGHSYFDRFPMGQFLEDHIAKFLLRFPFARLTSFAILALRKK